jgi:P27 family predicted phage terminase small subunit
LRAVVDAPAPPSGLLKASRERWIAFWSSDVARAVDVAADGDRLTRWITYVDEWHRAMRDFRRQRVAQGSMGQPRLHPLAGCLAQLEQAIARAEGELGLTPLARMKLGVATEEAALTAQRLNEITRGTDEPLMGEWAAGYGEAT